MAEDVEIGTVTTCRSVSQVLAAMADGRNGEDDELGRLLAHVRELEEQNALLQGAVDEQSEILEKVAERIGALLGASVTNDNGIQVTVVISKGVWKSLQRLLGQDDDDERKV